MIFLIVIFALLGAGALLVVYGTVTKNRWGINLGDVSCPRCSTPLQKVRQSRSLRREMWGGWTCSGCGAEVDKWGRELSGDRETSMKLRIFREGDKRREQGLNTFLDLFKRRSPVFWLIILPLVLLDIWYDCYHPGGIVFDVIGAMVLFVLYRKFRHTSG
jgi:hypothetical protein